MQDLFDKYKGLSIAVLGDYCLDEYLWIDAALNEASLETGLVAYQCVKQESFPGAAGTVAKNLANLGVGTVYAVGYAGNDGRGLELAQGLDRLSINREFLITAPTRATPAYVKPWITEKGTTNEMNRIDIKNHTTTPPELEDAILKNLAELLPRLDALIVLDHMTEEDCGVVTKKVRTALSQIAKDNPNCLMYADSRCRIGQFESMMIKGNQFEICHAVFGLKNAAPGIQLAADPTVERTEEEINHACQILQARNGRPVICTMGDQGLRIYHQGPTIEIPGIPLSGQLDVCGAGDMVSSTFVSSLAAGADMKAAGELSNVAASICVQQLGTSGNVTTELLLEAIL